jgi:pimeloyl-ACP methyl ester carboxylesterase
MLGDERWEALGEGLQAQRRAEGIALVAELRAIRAESAPYDLASVRCPVLAARGTTSAAHHRQAADELARSVGPGAGPTVVDGAGHGAHLSHPAAFAAWVLDVVSRVDS